VLLARPKSPPRNRARDIPARLVGRVAFALALWSVLAFPVAVGDEHVEPGRVELYPAVEQNGRLRHFRVEGLYDFTIRRGELRVGDLRQPIPLATLRTAARTHGLELALSGAMLDDERSSGPPVLAVHVTDALRPVRGALFGAWHRPTDAWWSSDGVAAFERALGRRLDIDHHYRRWGDLTWPKPHAEGDDVANGRVPLVSLGGRRDFPGLDAVVDGSQDDYLVALARRVRRLGAPFFLRPLWEMNGDWMVWGGARNNSRGRRDGPRKYVAAWRRMHSIFEREGATNAIWTWTPNCTDFPRASWNHWTSYYPGDAYVDWVGCDAFNRGTAQAQSHWRSFTELFGGMPSIYDDYDHKPFMVAETGACEQGGDKSRWIADAHRRTATAFPNIKAFVWFDARKLCDWRAYSSSAALRAVRRMAEDPYFAP
jgi:hypothetical protein